MNIETYYKNEAGEIAFDVDEAIDIVENKLNCKYANEALGYGAISDGLAFIKNYSGKFGMGYTIEFGRYYSKNKHKYFHKKRYYILNEAIS